MGERIDYYDDLTAPPVNSIKPSASAFVLHDGRVLLTQRSDKRQLVHARRRAGSRRVTKCDRGT